MGKSKDYQKSAQDARKLANQAAELSRLRSHDLDQMLHSEKGARERLTDGQDRQHHREQNPGRSISSLRTARFQAMESQLTSAFNYCLTAENGLVVLGRMANARRAIENATRIRGSTRSRQQTESYTCGFCVHNQSAIGRTRKTNITYRSAVRLSWR